MRTELFVAIACATLISYIEWCDSAEVATNMGGFSTIVCPGGSDTIASAPFFRPATFAGSVAAPPSIDGGSATIAISGNVDLAPGVFSSEAHYLKFIGESTRSGWVFPVTANDQSNITISLTDGDLNGVVVDDHVEVVPYWTLGTLFGPENPGTIHVSDSVLRPDRRTEILFFDETNAGFDLSPDRIYFRTPGGWVKAGGDYAPADDVILPPGKPFVIRHRQGDPETLFATFQCVNTEKIATFLKTRTDGAQDVAIGLERPIAVSLGELDLDQGAAFVESSRTDPQDRKDELHLFDNSVAAINRLPSSVFFRVAGQWHKDEAGYPLANDAEIEPGVGIMIRKAPTVDGASAIWLNTPRY